MRQFAYFSHANAHHNALLYKICIDSCTPQPKGQTSVALAGTLNKAGAAVFIHQSKNAVAFVAGLHIGSDFFMTAGVVYFQYPAGVKNIGFFEITAGMFFAGSNGVAVTALGGGRQ